jgi:hypothetical protein
VSRFRRYNRKYEVPCGICGEMMPGPRLSAHERSCPAGKRRVVEGREDASPPAPEARETLPDGEDEE